ncbi:hypothetical protein MPSEU_000461100 [Mayamaea pseudoterrestris]|nr:hypothetical protein MPSEU_000461100 [Mayamaea pseudoterrestris]
MSSSGCKAVCVLYAGSNNNNVIGHLKLSQTGDQTVISGELNGLTPGKHGICVCVSGDVSQGPVGCGPVFNPFGQTHGGPQDDKRMVGDLGNVLADESGKATVHITDRLVKLVGPHSVIGRSIVVHVGEDDQGRGGHENSMTTGNPGPRMAAGVIGLAV